MKRVLLAMSGGVDSSTAALILQQKGFEVIGVTMQLLENEVDIKSAKEICNKLSIEHYILDLRKEFNEEVVENFVFSYRNGITPNPCVMCNKKIKFGKLYDFSIEKNCEYFATGHYAKVEYDEILKQYVIKKSNALGKDQTYVLYGINKEIISHLIFPLGEFENKQQIRQIARENGLNVANKKDSQEICFISNNDYGAFIGESEAGSILNKAGKVLGKHKGFIHYTIGQRKGLGITNETPLYVIDINSKTNEIVVGSEKDLYKTDVYASNLNFLVPAIYDIEAKIRYSAKTASAKLQLLNDNKAKIIFDEPQKAVTPGQSIVFYKGDILIGGGIITKEE